MTLVKECRTIVDGMLEYSDKDTQEEGGNGLVTFPRKYQSAKLIMNVALLVFTHFYL